MFNPSSSGIANRLERLQEATIAHRAPEERPLLGAVLNLKELLALRLREAAAPRGLKCLKIKGR
jgi:hypothetical protein